MGTAMNDTAQHVMLVLNHLATVPVGIAAWRRGMQRAYEDALCVDAELAEAPAEALREAGYEAAPTAEC